MSAKTTSPGRRTPLSLSGVGNKPGASNKTVGCSGTGAGTSTSTGNTTNNSASNSTNGGMQLCNNLNSKVDNKAQQQQATISNANCTADFMSSKITTRRQSFISSGIGKTETNQNYFGNVKSQTSTSVCDNKLILSNKSDNKINEVSTSKDIRSTKMHKEENKTDKEEKNHDKAKNKLHEEEGRKEIEVNTTEGIKSLKTSKMEKDDKCEKGKEKIHDKPKDKLQEKEDQKEIAVNITKGIKSMKTNKMENDDKSEKGKERLHEKPKDRLQEKEDQKDIALNMIKIMKPIKNNKIEKEEEKIHDESKGEVEEKKGQVKAEVINNDMSSSIKVQQNIELIGETPKESCTKKSNELLTKDSDETIMLPEISCTIDPAPFIVHSNDGKRVKDSPSKTKQMDDEKPGTSTPKATSTPGKVLAFVTEDGRDIYKSGILQSVQTNNSNKVGAHLSYRISARRNIHDTSPLKYQNQQYRESYRCTNNEMDNTFSSTNATMGSEIQDESLLSFFGRRLKRERSAAHQENDAEVSSAKKVRGNFTSFMLSPITKLRNRFSKTTLQCSTPLKETKTSQIQVSEENENEDDNKISVQNQPLVIDQQNAENNDMNNGAINLGGEVNGENALQGVENMMEDDESEDEDLVPQEAPILPLNISESQNNLNQLLDEDVDDAQLDETSLHSIIDTEYEAVTKNKRCVVM